MAIKEIDIQPKQIEYNIHSINIGLLWNYLRNEVLFENINLNDDELFIFTENFFQLIIHNEDPFLDLTDDNTGKKKKYISIQLSKIDKSIENINDQLRYGIYRVRDKLYSASTKFTIIPKNSDITTFSYFLAFKLRSYQKTPSEVRPLLFFHKPQIEELNNFKEVLNDILDLYGEKIIPENIVKRVNEIITSIEQNKKTHITDDVRVKIERPIIDTYLKSDTTDLLKILFKANHIYCFEVFEKALIEFEYLDENNNWNISNPRNHKKYIATIFSILKDDFQWMKEPRKSNRKRSLAQYALFFEKRFGIEKLHSFFKTEKINRYSKPEYKAEFFLLKEEVKRKLKDII